MKKNSKIVIVMPAYNAERTVRDTFNDRRFAPENFRKTKISKHTPAIIFLGLIIIFFKHSASLNFWFWLFVFVQGVLLYFLLRPLPPKFLYKKFIFIMIPLVMGIFILVTGVCKDTFYISNFEKNQLWERQEMYRRELGVIGRTNRGNMAIGITKLYLDKLTRKTMEPFDLSRYFSADSSSVYYLIFFPLFIIGVCSLLAEEIKPIFYYLGFASLSAILVQSNMAYWLLVPLINLSILFGFTKLWVRYKK